MECGQTTLYFGSRRYPVRGRTKTLTELWSYRVPEDLIKSPGSFIRESLKYNTEHRFYRIQLFLLIKTNLFHLPWFCSPFPTYWRIQRQHRTGPFSYKLVEKRGIVYKTNGACCLSPRQRCFKSRDPDLPAAFSGLKHATLRLTLNLPFNLMQGLNVCTSGVTSRGANPVPPVVSIRFSSCSSHHSKRVSCTHDKNQS